MARTLKQGSGRKGERRISRLLDLHLDLHLHSLASRKMREGRLGFKGWLSSVRRWA